jgi:hypothetical protein
MRAWKRKPRGNVKETLIGRIQSLARLEPAFPEVTNYLRSEGIFDDLEEKGQKAISDFYLYIRMQLCWVEEFDLAAKSHSHKPHLGHPTPAIREKLKSISRRLAEAIDMASSQGLRGQQLLLDAQSKLKQLREQPPPIAERVRYTGDEYLYWCDCAWSVRRPAVAYAFFVLLRRYSKPRLSKRKAYERIGRLQKSLFGVNLATDSIKKMISLFSSDRNAGRMRRFLTKVEMLPPFKRTK